MFLKKILSFFLPTTKCTFAILIFAKLILSMNMFTSQHPKSFFLSNIFCTKVVFNDQVAIARMSIWNLQLKRQIGGSTEILETFSTELQRIRGIEREFGVTLTDEERIAIEGRKVGVKGFDLESQSFEY